MGKTLKAQFEGCCDIELYQLYFHSGLPTSSKVCRHYYKFSDLDALISIFHRWHKGKEIELLTDSSPNQDEGIICRIYTQARKRKALTYFLRELVWSLSNWKNSKLHQWVCNAKPDVIYFASGDYAFSYKIALYFSKLLKIPLVVSCMDDYYNYNKNEHTFIGRIWHAMFMKCVGDTIGYASCLQTICDDMNVAYRKRFNKHCFTLYTTATDKQLNYESGRQQLSYIGNLGLGRYKQLIDLGKALQKIDNNRNICVYSGEIDQSIIGALQSAPGIEYRGKISASEVLQVMNNSLAVIHVESFDKEIVQSVKYSISTKIAESLKYGPCILAYGPNEVASIAYLKVHNAAYIISSKSELESRLRNFLKNELLREYIVKNAREIGRNNHSAEVNQQKLLSELKKAIAEYKTKYENSSN